MLADDFGGGRDSSRVIMRNDLKQLQYWRPLLASTNDRQDLNVH